MNWKRWNWPRVIVLPVAFSLLRTCWLWAWLELVRRWVVPSQQRVLMPLPVMMGLVLGAMALGRRAGTGERGLNRARLAAAGAGLLAILLVLWWRFYWWQYWVWDPRWLAAAGRELAHWGTELPGPVVVLVAASHLWLQGIQDASRSLNVDEAWAAFVGGLVGLALALLAAGLDGRGMPRGTTSVVLCFAAGMGALAISNLESWRAGEDEEGGSPLAANRYWLGSVLIVIGGLLAAGLLLSLLIAPESLAAALRWTSAILSIIGRLAAFVLVAAAYLIFLVLTPLINWLSAWLRSLSQSIEQPRELEVPNFQEQLEGLQRNANASAGSDEALRWLGLAAVVAMIMLAFALAVRRLRTREQNGVEETRESVFSRALLREQLAALWHEWLGRLRETPGVVLSPFLSLEGEVPTRRMVRAAYQALLAAAAARELPRLRGQTPVEYQYSLEEARAGAKEVLGTITDGYELARYAPEPPTLEEAQRVCRAWEQLRPTLEAPGSGMQE